jgi:hypothetical protein
MNTTILPPASQADRLRRLADVIDWHNLQSTEFTIYIDACSLADLVCWADALGSDTVFVHRPAHGKTPTGIEVLLRDHTTHLVTSVTITVDRIDGLVIPHSRGGFLGQFVPVDRLRQEVARREQAAAGTRVTA